MTSLHARQTTEISAHSQKQGEPAFIIYSDSDGLGIALLVGAVAMKLVRLPGLHEHHSL